MMAKKMYRCAAPSVKHHSKELNEEIMPLDAKVSRELGSNVKFIFPSEFGGIVNDCGQEDGVDTENDASDFNDETVHIAQDWLNLLSSLTIHF